MELSDNIRTAQKSGIIKLGAGRFMSGSIRNDNHISHYGVCVTEKDNWRTRANNKPLTIKKRVL